MYVLGSAIQISEGKSDIRRRISLLSLHPNLSEVNFVHFANCEMSILSNDAVHLLLQCVCDDRGSPWSLNVMNICSPIPKYFAPFSDNSRVHNIFTIDCNKSSVNFTGSNVFRLQKPSQASHLTVGGIRYRRVYCHNPLHSQREKVRYTNCTS